MPAKTFEYILKFNPYHDSRGRFASANSATSFTYQTKDPSKQHLADRAREREKERQAGGSKPDGEGDSPRMKTVHEIEDKIRAQFYETAAVVDKGGKVLFMKDGSENMVGFTREECDMMNGSTLTHNHPLSSMLSVEDATCFVKGGLEEMRATNREGITYSLKRAEGLTEDTGHYFLRDFDGAYKSARWAAQDDLDSRGFRGKVMDGEITQAEANKEYGKVVAREMTQWCESHASQYGIDFSVEKRDVEPAYNVGTYTSKSAGNDDLEIILDQETNEQNDAAFNEWLNGTHEKKEKTEKSFSVLKTADDKRLVFGWASVSFTIDGEQLEDHQKDMIDPEDLEEAVYDYVLNFRDAGEEHIPSLRMKGKLVESCVFTKEKQKAMGIPEGIVPIGWWIGFKIEDDAAWEKVKNGTYKMFSIEGKANRVPVEKAAPVEEPVICKTDPDRFDRIKEFP